MGDLFEHGYALLVGVGKDLPESVADARALYNIFIDPKRAAYPAEHTLCITEQDATRQNIVSSLDTLITRVHADPAATAIVYFSGHGGIFERKMHPKQYFLVPYDYDPDHFEKTTLSDRDFTKKIEAIKAQKLVVILDCCHAGGIPMLKTEGDKFSKGNVPPSLLRLMESGRGRVVIASSQSDQTSLGGHPNSLFTECLLEALQGKGARVADGFARVLDVLSYLFAEVPMRARPKEQNPYVKRVDDLSDNFALCYYAGGEKKASGIPLTADPFYNFATWENERLEKKGVSLRSTFNLWYKKVELYRNALAIETDVGQKFKYEYELLDAEANAARIEKQLEEIQRILKERN